jgi:hypothetical protein
MVKLYLHIKNIIHLQCNRSNTASHCSLVLCLLSDNNTMSACRISITTKIYIPSPFQKTIYWEYPHGCRRTTSTTYGQKIYRFMFQRIKFLQKVIRNKSEDKKDVMSDGRMWMNSRSWCTLNLNNISLYFLHSRLNMTPVVYRFLSLFTVFPFDFFISRSRINPAYVRN